MGTNVFAVAYYSKKYVELTIISDSDIKSLATISNPQTTLIKLIDPYDNTFFNKKQINQLKNELNILSQNNDAEAVPIINTLKSIINDERLTNYEYLVLLGD